jgi:hypothetical protein
MTAKEQLLELIESFTEEEAVDALRKIDEWEAAGKPSHPSVFPQLPGRPATAAEFEEHFGDLPTDDEP